MKTTTIRPGSGTGHLASLAVAVTLAAGPVLAQPEALQLPAPADREGQTLAVDGAEIFYSDSGEGSALVLLHGYPLSGALFERVRDALDDHHRVITIDHRGYGKSTTPAAVEDVETYASDALAVLSQIGVGQAVIGGMSMGGPILFEMYRQNPDVFAGAILIDTIHTAASPMEKGIWQGTETALNEQGQMDAIIPFLMSKMLTGETRQNQPAQVDYLTTAMQQASIEGAIGGAKVLANRPDSTDTLKQMDVPVMVLTGLADPVYPFEIAKEMADLASDGTLALIEGGSHAAIFEQPEASAAAILDWTSKLDGS